MAIYHIGKYTGIYHTLKRAGKGHHIGLSIYISYRPTTKRAKISLVNRKN